MSIIELGVDYAKAYIEGTITERNDAAALDALMQEKVPGAVLSTYTDAADMADFAVDAFEWAVAEGVIRGTSNTTLEPLATTNREQVVLMIHRLLAKQD
jgi:hypothetical protein